MSLPTLISWPAQCSPSPRVCKVLDGHFARKEKASKILKKLFLEVHPKTKEFVDSQEMQLIGGCEYFDQ